MALGQDLYPVVILPVRNPAFSPGKCADVESYFHRDENEQLLLRATEPVTKSQRRILAQEACPVAATESVESDTLR